MAEHGEFFWNELMTRDVGRAKAFYEKVLGWSFSEMPMPENGVYHVAVQGEKMIGGMMEMPDGPEFEGVPEHWLAYIAVDDIDARLKAAKAESAEVIREPFDVAQVGRIAILKDGGGAVVGWMTPTEMSGG